MRRGRLAGLVVLSVILAAPAAEGRTTRRTTTTAKRGVATTRPLARPATTAPPARAVGDPRSVVTCTPHSFPQRTQRSLAVDPTDDRVVYIGVEQAGFFKSTDGGATWRRADAGMVAWGRSGAPSEPCFEEFYETVVSPVAPNRVCVARAGGPGTVAVRSSAGTNGVWCSADGGASWVQRVTATMNTAAYSLAMHPTNPDVMYAGVNGGPCSNPPPACAPGTYFNTRGAVYKTLDGGRTWTELDARYVADQRVVTVRLDPARPQVVVAGTFGKLAAGGPGNFGAAQSGVLRSTDDGRSWTASTSGMSASPSEQALLFMEISPRKGSQLYATASSNTGYWSGDGGATFERTARLSAMAYDPNDPSGLHALGTNGIRMIESRDGGRTWVDAGAAPPGFTETETPTDLEWSRQRPGTVYLAGPRARVFRSTDAGHTWQQVLVSGSLPR